MTRFISFEGGEGAGKSTQARRLAETLRARGHDVLLTREPGGAPGAELIRGLLLDPAGDWSPSAEILLHFAARAEHVERAIAPALARGALVITDRFFDSTMAYQGSPERSGLVRALTDLVPITPNLTFVLDVTPETRATRLAARGGAPDRYEAKPEAFHRRVADAFRAIAAANPARCVLIDANDPPDHVEARILHALGHAIDQTPDANHPGAQA
jgi:dTMP kinase